VADKTWKQVERRCASLFGCERKALSGGNSGGSRSDTTHDRLYIEVKHRKRWAIWSLYEDTKDKAVKEGRIPVCVLDQHRKHGCLVCVHSNDLFDFAAEVLLGDVDRGTEAINAVANKRTRGRGPTATV